MAECFRCLATCKGKRVPTKLFGTVTLCDDCELEYRKMNTAFRESKKNHDNYKGESL